MLYCKQKSCSGHVVKCKIDPDAQHLFICALEPVQNLSEMAENLGLSA